MSLSKSSRARVLDEFARAVLFENLRPTPLPLAAVRQATLTVYSCCRLIVIYLDILNRLSHATVLQSTHVHFHMSFQTRRLQKDT